MLLKLDNASLNAIFALPRIDGAFEGELAQMARALGKRRPFVLLAFPPKSAGTFFRSAAIFATNGELARIVHAEGGRDPAPYLPTVIAYYLGAVTSRTLVTHIHMQATIGNRHFLNAFDIRPIIMLRSVPDMLASLWDMVEEDPSMLLGLSFLVPDDFLTMSRARKSDFFVDIMGPWYTNYFANWMTYAQSDRDRVCVLHYRDLKSDPTDTLMRALKHAGVPCPYEDCEAALKRAWGVRKGYRFNKGEHGRGQKYFSEDQIARLERMLSHYDVLAPHMDELLGSGAFAPGAVVAAA